MFPNLGQKGTVSFGIVLPNKNEIGEENLGRKRNESRLQSIFLLSELNSVSIFDNIPKDFTISTKSGKCIFNLEMLKEASPVIADLIKDNQNERQYFLDIIDEENVLSKFELLFSGQTVNFVEDDFHLTKKITKLLQIINCPNPLKPANLQRNTRYELRHPTLYKGPSLPISINIGSLVNFLNRDDYMSFKIITKKKEYICNIFGVYSSKIIHQNLNENHSLDQYVYDFEDEYDEFQSICDFFNFKEVGLTRNNMQSIQKIAEDLQIDCILDQVYNYIENYDKNYQTINEKQKIIDSIDELFDLLYNIKTIGIENVKNSICQSNFSKKKEEVQELAAFILQVVKPDFSLQKEMAELLIQLNKEANKNNQLSILIPFIVDNLMNYYMPFKQYDNKNNSSYINEKIDLTNRCIYSFIRILYKKGLIPKEKIIEKLKDYDCKNMTINAFFLPEIIEINPKNKSLITMINLKLETNLQNLNFILLVNKFLPDKIELYERMLDDMEPYDELTKSIRHDDVDTLQSIISNILININDITIPYNIFDDFEESPNIINYAALCGSIKSFKYLLLNNGNVNEETFYYAVYGGNTEIIKIVEQNMQDVSFYTHNHHSVNYTYDINSKINSSILWFNYINNRGYGFSKYNINNPINLRRSNHSSDKEIWDYYNDFISFKIHQNLRTTTMNYRNINNVIASTIALHRDDLFDWIFEKEYSNKRIKGDELIDIAILSAATGNAHSLIKIIDEGFDISSSSSCNHIIYFCAKNGFYKLLQLILSVIESCYNKNTTSPIYISSVLFGNLSIFKLFINKMHMPATFIQYSLTIAIDMNYKDIIDLYLDNIETIDQTLINNSLKTSIQTTKTDNLFIYLIEKFKKINPKFINANTYIELLNTACLHSNLLATKALTDLILSEYPDSDFSNAFITATSSNSMDICSYLIDKKVNINYYEFLSDVSKLGSMDINIFEMIYNKVDSSAKYQLLGCVDEAIEKKNKKLIEFCLKKNIQIPNGLHHAVKTHDIEIVDLILKYNSEPSFINQLTNDGTAICYASKFKDLDIVKRLLAVPGIDPGLFNSENKNALTEAINNYDYDIVEAILDFYGDDIASNLYLVSIAFQELHICLNKPQTNEYMWKIIKKFLSIKSIDPNFIMYRSLLYKACENNEIDIVDYLLKLDKIDVNQYDIKTYNTPLIISIIKKNTKIAKLLINHPKTNINLKNMQNESPLILAIRNNSEEIIKLLINDKRFDQYESNIGFALIMSTEKIFEQLCSLDFIDVNYYFQISKRNKKVQFTGDKQSYINFTTTPLDHFTKINDVDRIDTIINHPMFDKYKSNISSAIFHSIKANNTDVFKKLIKIIDNDVNIYDKHGRSFLVVAALNSSGDIIDEIFNNPNFDARKNQIFRAFVDSYSNPSVYKQRINLQMINPPLNYHPQTVLNSHLLPNKSTVVEIMDKIISYDENHDHLIDLNKMTQKGKSVLTSIRYNNQDTSEITDFLIDHGANPNLKDSNKVLPLIHAMSLSNMLSSLLNSNKLDIEMRFSYTFSGLNQFKQTSVETTYFHVAASMYDANLLTALIDKYPDGINAIDENGETPLMIACKQSLVKNINILFEKDNLDFLHRNNEGKDALEIIQKLPFEDVENARKNKQLYHQKILDYLKSLTMNDDFFDDDFLYF